MILKTKGIKRMKLSDFITKTIEEINTAVKFPDKVDHQQVELNLQVSPRGSGDINVLGRKTGSQTTPASTMKFTLFVHNKED